MTTSTSSSSSTTSRRANYKLKMLSIVHNYNMHMGSVDLTNMLSGLHRVNRKSRNWTKAIFWVTRQTDGCCIEENMNCFLGKDGQYRFTGLYDQHK
ncbi:hypothetical protein T07_8663 [Trichinella nelsoni]|uniref:PiggyBac transposable element-derived protein domain-containing protein n=1 Tax=Trichinella nelsoni TaxID=6336 RepID=A0A0V0S689_9BILA|nr:hypothetical protein T07_8663 [Trichinella nelsoni]